MKKVTPYLFGLLLAGFGLITLFLTSSVIFDLFGIRAKEGNYVLLVVWANFICSQLYLFAAYGFINSKKWTPGLLGISALILFITLLGLFYHINTGGLYETKTIGAMVLRISITLLFAVIAYVTITKKRKGIPK